MEREDVMPHEMMAALAEGRGWVSATREVGALGVTGSTTIDTMANEIIRLRGIIETARHYCGEDMPSTAYIALCGMGLEDGIDSSLVGSPIAQRGIAIEDARCEVEAAARALVAMLTTDLLPHGRWEEVRDLREALARLDERAER